MDSLAPTTAPSFPLGWPTAVSLPGKSTGPLKITNATSKPTGWCLNSYGGITCYLTQTWFPLFNGASSADYPWKQDQHLFEQWINGETIEPFVNANMIELQKTGFMSNRGRQNVPASPNSSTSIGAGARLISRPCLSTTMSTATLALELQCWCGQ